MVLLSISRARMIRRVKKVVRQTSDSEELWAGATRRLMFTRPLSMLVALKACGAKPYRSTRRIKVFLSQETSKNEWRLLRARKGA